MMIRGRMPSPLEWWAVSFQAAMLAAESQMVIAMRLWGMVGLWSIQPGETYRMVGEKPKVFANSATAAARAAWRGEEPSQIASAALRPVRKATRSNSRRLAKRGPKLF